MSELSRLIERLQRGIARNASYIQTIRHPELLVTTLQELHDLIGNDKIKDAVATQVSHLIMIKRRALSNPAVKEDEVMLNTVLYGPPGVGKTMVGTKLAKIWYSLGYLDASRNAKERKQELGDVLKDLFKDSGTSTSGSSDDTALTLYIMFFFIMILVTVLSMTWSFYSRFGGFWTLAAVGIFVLIILIVGYFVASSLNTGSSASLDAKKNSKDTKDANKPVKKDTPRPKAGEMPSDDQVIKVVTRGDFVDRYVGWTSPKTKKLLEENLGKVLFVDEAYSLINGPHDEFGMEALTTLNLFLSEHSKEIIVIFAGYKDLLETGPYSVQPGLKRRFMWQFDCDGYTPDQLFEIFKMQLAKKGWGLTNEAAVRRLFTENHDAFPAFGGDTERAGFFAELEHSRDYLANDQGMQINMLDPEHIARGIHKLRENNIQDAPGAASSNPLANMMRLMSNNKSATNSAKPKPREPRPRTDVEPVSDELDESVLELIRAQSANYMQH